jgi:hypothetical protein
MSWSIDGVSWDYPCSVQREADVTSSELSGMMLDRTYYNDVIATYMKYSVTIAVPFGKEAEYSAIYELLTKPVPHHSFVFPYNQTTITVNGRVSAVSDRYVRLPRNRTTWRQIAFDVTANNPIKVKGSTKDYGLTPFPDAARAAVGTIYEMTSSGWQMITLEDCDTKRY